MVAFKNLIPVGCVLLSIATKALGAVSWIVPGAIWYDTAGVRIDAHGGMITKPGTVYYWVGQSLSSNVSPRIYSSRDLMNWDNVGLAAPDVVQFWRPKLFASGGKFWIWGQVDRWIQPLRSTSITSGYVRSGPSFPIPPANWTYSDGGLFTDDDGSTYFLTSADHNNVAINVANGDGTIGTRIAAIGRITKGALEAPGILKSNGVYYLIVSGKTGYRANPNKSYWATSLAGPWNGGTDIAPPEVNTYNSQNTFELKIVGSSVTTHIYMGDAWATGGSAESNYEWLPITIDGSAHTLTLRNLAMWKINPTTGVVSVPATGKLYEAADAVLMGRAAIANCESCLSKRVVHQVDHQSNVTFTGVEGIGQKQWVAVHYTTTDSTTGDAHVLHVNGKKLRLRDLNTRANVHSIVPVALHLNKGTDNTITFSSDGLGVEGRIEAIEVWDGSEGEVELPSN